MSATPPKLYRQAGTLMLVAGLMNALIGGAVSIGLLFFFPPCCCVGILPLAWGSLEIAVGLRAANGHYSPWIRRLSIPGIVVGAVSLPLGGFLPLILEVLVTVCLRDEEVNMFLEDQASA
jgi:hypothetical protein